jgi:8-oxo-dGTP diphosphatase
MAVNGGAPGRVPVHVAAAAVNDDQGRILITRRADHVHQGGLWEFPGGKVEPGETTAQALRRELLEELGIQALGSEPLIRVLHHYRDRSVLLDVHRVNAYSGVVEGREGQPWRWVPPGVLRDYAFPAADRPIITALLLPGRYLITGEDAVRSDEFLARLEQALDAGIELVQLRAKTLMEDEYRKLARRAVALCGERGARLLLNGPLELTLRLHAHGIHLTSAQLMNLPERPLGQDRLIGASCHNRNELMRAQDLGLDFAVLSPVRPTLSHPQAAPLGWEGFRRLVDQTAMPIYALGGMGAGDLTQAKRAGAQGIAAIRGLWPLSTGSDAE